MKTSTVALGLLPWLVAALLVTSHAPGGAHRLLAQGASDPEHAGDSAQPFISSIRVDRDDVVVVVQLPAGFRKVVIESRSRLESGSWTPRSVIRPEGEGRELIVRLPLSAGMELLRVRAATEGDLPASFYSGERSFASLPGFEGPPGDGVFLGPDAVRDGTEAGDSRDVVESDIWRLHGDTLYFFNQFRGLQVLDLSEPDAPSLAGTLALPAAGEQMYVLSDEHVVLLARDGCGWGIDGPSSQLLIVGVSGHEPVVQAGLPISGHIQESRLVGSALYVAAQTYRSVTRPNDAGTGTIEVWEWGTIVSSFDLAAPSDPVARESFWFPGWGNSVMATDRLLFVSSRDTRTWWRSIIQVIDISAPDGAMTSLGSIAAAGYVADKFKMHLKENVFTVISQAWTDTRRWVTSLETFSLENASDPKRLARLELAEGEQLYATRFDGDRVYIVTYFIIDPLWVVDLSNPAEPKITGELEVPGWSTYIHPLGDYLVTVGIDDTEGWRVAVSLFNVTNPSEPGLAGKVILGENYSWTEANRDEKAINVLAEQGLILVPYQGDSVEGYAQRVQLIDLDLSSDTPLRVRGFIDHAMQPRRATVHRDRIFSISGKELLGVDATDRDAPLVRSQLELSWAAHRVFVQGEYLIQIDHGSSWGVPGHPSVRVARTDAPGEILSRFELPAGVPIAGAALDQEHLYIAQMPPGNGWIILPLEDGTYERIEDTNSVLVVTAVRLTHLPEVTLAGQTEVQTRPPGWNPALKALWPKPGVLVWSSSMGGGWWWPHPWLDVAAGRNLDGALVEPASMWSPWFWGGENGRFWAFDVASPEAPEFLSETSLAADNWWSFSEARHAGGLVFVSHHKFEFLEGANSPVEEQAPPPPEEGNDDGTPPQAAGDDKNDTSSQPAPPEGIWVQRHYLEVIDYSDPRDPTVRPPINIPGALEGVSHGGALLYTIGQRWNTETWTTDWTEWLAAAAYDGVDAFLVDSMELPRNWPRPVLISGDRPAHIFIGNPGSHDSADGVGGQLETWGLADTGKFTRLGSLSLESPAQNLAMFGSLLAADTSGRMLLLDATVPEDLKRLGSGRPDGCLWFDLTHADGSLEDGLWLPLGDYGTFHIRP